MTVKEFIEHLQTLSPDALVLRHDGRGWRERTAGYVPSVGRYGKEGDYYVRRFEWEEFRKGIDAVAL